MERRNFEKVGLKISLCLSLARSLGRVVTAPNDGFLAIDIRNGNPLILELRYEFWEA